MSETEVRFADPDVATYNAFATALKLEEIQLVKIDGERRVAGEPASVNFSFGGSFHSEGALLQIRYEAKASLVGGDGGVLTEVNASVVVALAMGVEGTPECYDRFARHSGALMAQPYLREVIQATAARLGHPSVVMPVTVLIPSLPMAVPAAD